MYVVRQANQNDYQYREIYIDNISELPNVLQAYPKTCPGSIVLVIDTSEVYCLNSQFEWILL